jgi:hypothetical protein
MEDTGTRPLRSNGYELFIPISMPEREVDVNTANPQPISDLEADLIMRRLSYRGRGRYRNRGRNSIGFIDTDTDTDPDADGPLSIIRIAAELKADLEADGAACYTVGNGPVVFVKGAGL